MQKEVEIVERALRNDSLFQESLELVRQNAYGGQVWAIGGIVYRTIVQGLYGVKFTAADYDFIIENQKPFETITLPKDWVLGKTPLNSPRFIKGNWQIDAVPIDNIRKPSSPIDFSTMTSEQKVMHYCDLVPLDIQAIAYDLDNKKLIGDSAMRAIRSRKVGVQCLEELVGQAKWTHLTARKYLEKKAKSLGFEPDYDGLK